MNEENLLQYKGYTGVAEVDFEAGILHGHVVGIRDVVTFQGETPAEARRAFEESVDDYVRFCAERGEEPEKPYSGKFLVRLDPELHRALAHAAEARGISLNALVAQALATAVPGGEVAAAQREPSSPPSRRAAGGGSPPKAGRSRPKGPARRRATASD